MEVFIQPLVGKPLKCTNSWVDTSELVANIRLDFPDINPITIPVECVARDVILYFVAYRSHSDFNFRYCVDLLYLLDYFGCPSEAYSDLLRRIRIPPPNSGDCLMRCIALKKLTERGMDTSDCLYQYIDKDHAALLVESGMYTSKFVSEYVRDDCPVLADWKMPPDTPLLKHIHFTLDGLEYSLSGEYMMAHAIGLETRKLSLMLFGDLMLISKRLGITSCIFSNQPVEGRLRVSLGNPIRIIHQGECEYFGSPEAQVIVRGDLVYATPGWHIYEKLIFREYLLLKKVPLPLNVYSWSRAGRKLNGVELYCEDLDLGDKFSVSNVDIGNDIIPLGNLSTDTNRRIPCCIIKSRLEVSKSNSVCIGPSHRAQLIRDVNKVISNSIHRDEALHILIVGVYDALPEPHPRADVFINGKLEVSVLVNGVIREKNRKKEALVVLTIL